MNKNVGEEQLVRHRSRRKSKRKARRRYRKLFLLVVLCSIAMVFAFKGSHGRVLPDENKQSDTLNTNIKSGHIDDLQTQNDESSTEDNNIEENSWSLILVNRWNPIPNGYKAEQTELANGQAVDVRIYPALQEMFDDARKDNIYPVVASGYRTAEKQQSLMDEKIADYRAEGYSAEEAKTKAEAWVAIPGTSEHQLGLGVDINADGVHSKGKEVYEWLERNSYKYGFIRRYPEDKTAITGVINEPWHYRYVGIEAATEIKNQGICLEEYLNKIDGKEWEIDYPLSADTKIEP